MIGCDETPAAAPAGFGANGIAIDQSTNQIYATNISDTSVTTINGTACNGTNATNCGDTRTEATVGDYPSSISVDRGGRHRLRGKHRRGVSHRTQPLTRGAAGPRRTVRQPAARSRTSASQKRGVRSRSRRAVRRLRFRP